MLRSLRKPKAQVIFEHILLLVIIIGAFLAMQLHLKRSLQGRLKASADDLGEQFSPGNTKITKRIISTGASKESLESGVVRSELKSAEVFNITQNMAIHATSFENWGR